MSYHWENTVWQSKDGSWNHGYYHRISNESSPQGWGDEDYDSEWDDEFDTSRFDAVRTGFRDEESASLWTPYGNPGSLEILHYSGNSKECKELDLLAFYHAHPEERAKAERKELLRKNREHFKALAAEWTPERIRQVLRGHVRLQAAIKHTEDVHSYFGGSTLVSGSFKEVGDWLEIEGKRIYNLKTDKFQGRVQRLQLRNQPIYR